MIDPVMAIEVCYFVIGVAAFVGLVCRWVEDFMNAR